MHTVLVTVGSLLVFVGLGSYVWDIVHGPVRPERMTRFLLAVITGLSFVSLFAGDDRSGVWLALASFIESLVLFGLSLWRGIGGANRLDIICLVLCVGGVAWWLVSGKSLVGLAASVIADCVACIPSIVKTVRLPHTESLWFYLLGVMSAACIVLAGPYDWRSLLFPVYLGAINAVFVVSIIWPRRARRLRIANEDKGVRWQV